MKKLLWAVAALFMGCSPKLPKAEVKIPEKYIYEQGFNCSDDTIEQRWWESFCDTTLNRIMEVALYENHDLGAALANVEASRHYLKVARAEFLPSLSFGAEAEEVHEEKVTEQEYRVAPAINWEISLFGELRNTKRSALAALFQQEWNVKGVWLSLTSEVATSYFTLRQYQRSLYIATRSFELRQKATALVDSMYRYGMSNGTDLMQAKSLVYAAKVEMTKYERAVAATSLSLSVLLGEVPHEVDWSSTGDALIFDELPLDIPIGLPSSLLERRPDVMKSYYAMLQAAAEVGISRAQRYPSITISGSGGVYATTLKGLTSGNPLLWSATGELTAPIFSWGALKRKELAMRAKYEASAESYQQAVLEAIADVEQNLVAIDTYGSETTATAALVLANTKIAENTSALYKGGMSNYLSVIDAERELYSSQISLIELVAQQYINYVDLYKSLGGGW